MILAHGPEQFHSLVAAAGLVGLVASCFLAVGLLGRHLGPIVVAVAGLTLFFVRLLQLVGYDLAMPVVWVVFFPLGLTLLACSIRIPPEGKLWKRPAVALGFLCLLLGLFSIFHQ